VPESAPGERRVRVRTKETLGSSGGGAMATNPTPATTPKANGFDAAAETLCTAFDAYSQGLLFRNPSDDVDLLQERVLIASWVDCCNKYGKAMVLRTGQSVYTSTTAQCSSWPPTSSALSLTHCFSAAR
jgi:cell cycle serine/threonine-protein kinase CDC5/MSD2